MAVEPKSTKDLDKMNKALSRLENEDPSFEVKEDLETGQTLIAGMGELHLDIMVDRLKREFSVVVNTGSPQVSYREGIAGSGQHQEVFERQLGQNRQFAEVTLSIKANTETNSQQNKIKVDLSKAILPANFGKAIRKGIEESLVSGIIAGFPVIGTEVEVTTIRLDEDSDEVSFQIAANLATRNAIKLAQATLLEPIMKLEVIVPENYASNVIADLNTRRAKVAGIGIKGDQQVIDAHVPLSEMFGYSTSIRSLSQGRAAYTLKFAHYERVSDKTLKSVTGG
jgi:elongation factor G